IYLFCYIGCFEYFFFFQAEDGIRDFHVTGVQTCALPICRPFRRAPSEWPSSAHSGSTRAGSSPSAASRVRECASRSAACRSRRQIGRASCRDRVTVSSGAPSEKKESLTKQDTLTPNYWYK